MSDLIGSIEVGKQADLICVDLSAIETQPIYHVISQLVYSCGRQQVSDVWIAGVAKLEQGQLLAMDSIALKQKAQHWRQRISRIR